MTTANDTPTAVLAPTEASPLLGDGHIADQTPNYSGREAEANGPQNDQDEPERMGNPEVAKKMHLIVPAIGIGVRLPSSTSRQVSILMTQQLYLVAVDQLLTVAAYAKIGNELNALNNMSWIATSFVLSHTTPQQPGS